MTYSSSSASHRAATSEVCWCLKKAFLVYSAEDGDPDSRIVSFLKREEVARRLVQAYTLQRVQRRDWPTVLELLACIGQVGCCCD